LRLDFSDLFDISSYVKKLIPLLSNKYPIRNKEEEISVFFSDLINNKESKHSPVPVDNYIFANIDTTNQIKINSRFISLIFTKYKDFEDMIADFNMVFDEFTKTYTNIAYTRLGLRKINILELEENKGVLQTFKDYFNDYLVHHLVSGPFDSTLSTDQHTMISQDSNNMNLILKHATQNGVRNDKSYRRFILDIDYYMKELTNKFIPEQLSILNQRIFDVFYWSISDKLKGDLRK